MSTKRQRREWVKARPGRGERARSKPKVDEVPKPAPKAATWKVEYLNETVVAEIDGWPAPVRARLQRIIEWIESRGLQSLTAEHAKHIRGRIWELRPDGDKVQGRAFYVTTKGKRIVIVLGKIKKTQKTPKAWIDLAEQRAKTLDKGDEE